MSDRRLVPNGSYVSVLYRTREPGPAIVVGGGPSAPEQLAALPDYVKADSIFVSANAHSFKLGIRPDFIVCKDHKHTETGAFMEDELRPFDVPIASRQHWADYRLGAWPTQGNSGMMAIGLAVLLGCRPVIPVGFDCYQKGTYFHDLTANNVSRGRAESLWRSRYQRLRDRLVGAAIRPPRDALFNLFPAFDGSERFERYHMPVCLRVYEKAPWEHVRATRKILSRHSRVEIPEGYVFPADASELAEYRREGCVEKVDTSPAA